MRIKNFYLMSMLILIFMSIRHDASGQCDQESIKASNYLNGSCNGMYFQGLIGSINSTFGDCGDLYFDAPLTGGDVTTSTKNVILDLGVQVFPNPTLGDVVITLPDGQSYDIQFYNAIGQLLRRENLRNQGSHYLSIEDLQPGYYIIKINVASNKTQIHKIIKL